MARFRGRVVISGYIEVEGEDCWSADEAGQELEPHDILSRLDPYDLDIEVFPDEFPEEI